MSRTRKGSKQLGYDYWSKRPYSGCGYGSHIKDMCHRAERMQEKGIVREEVNRSWVEHQCGYIYDLSNEPFTKAYFLTLTRLNITRA